MNKNKARTLLGKAQLEDANRLLNKEKYIGRTLDALVTIVRECKTIPVFSALSPGDVAWARKVIEVQEESNRHHNDHIRCLQYVWNRLEKKHPELYSLPTCEIGWYDLIDKTLTQVEEVFAGSSCLDGLKTYQIKEKFGALRIYLWFDADVCDSDPVDQEARGVVAQGILTEAEKISLTICELCGNEGKLRDKDRHWHRTLCDSCDEATKED